MLSTKTRSPGTWSSLRALGYLAALTCAAAVSPGEARAQGFDIFSPGKLLKHIVPHVVIPVTPHGAPSVRIGGVNGGGGVTIGVGGGFNTNFSGGVSVSLYVVPEIYIPRTPVQFSAIRRHRAHGYRATGTVQGGSGLANFSLSKDEIDSRRSARDDEKRNVDNAVARFIDDVRSWYGELKKSLNGKAEVAIRAANSGDFTEITQDEILHILDQAYADAHLSQFEISGEMWTRERLKVQIVDKAMLGLRPFFIGVNAKGPGKEELTRLFKEAAGEVYQFAMESNELLGLTRSFDRLTRTIYEATDEQSNDQVNSATSLIASEDRIESFVTYALKQSGTAAAFATPVSTAVTVNTGEATSTEERPIGDLSFALRLRARRTTFDCISIVFPKLVNPQGTQAPGTVMADGGPASVASDTEASAAEASSKPELLLTKGTTVILASSTEVASSALGKFQNDLERRVWIEISHRCMTTVSQLDAAKMRPLPARAEVNGLKAIFNGSELQ